MNNKINPLLFTFLSIFTLCWAKSQNETIILRRITREFERKYGENAIYSLFLKYNAEASKNIDFRRVLTCNDTLFLINQYGPTSGRKYCMIWNSHDTMSYQAEQSIVKVSSDMIYNHVALEAIGKWDSLLFSQSSQTSLFDVGLMYIARIVVRSESIAVECHIIHQQPEW